MKKALCLLLCLILVLAAFASCKTGEEDTSTDGHSDAPGEDTVTAAETTGERKETAARTTEETETDVSEDTTVSEQDAAFLNMLNNFPSIDGSTSTIPLEAGVRAALYGITAEEAGKSIVHSGTYMSFYNLLQGKCKLIFTVPASEQQLQDAEDDGISLVQTPIAMEGFVFVLNAGNPVSTLTQQQLKDIYSGKITNWKDVGGDDAEIIAYQRNESSGSQNYMKKFMGDLPLMKPVTTIIPATMSGLMDAVAEYENSKYAIGYSVYAYAADMYVQEGQIKFVQVDGVAPSKATMADGSYR